MDDRQYEIELIRLEIERTKLDLEGKRLSLERTRIWLGVPLFTIVATVLLGIWTQHQQSENTFALKAAEIVMSATTANGVANKAFALKAIFPERLPENFASSFDPKQLPYQQQDFPADAPASKAIPSPPIRQSEHAPDLGASPLCSGSPLDPIGCRPWR